ncbi:hypothetical protein [Bradyrhizobium manausense]|nr:hypothetical protein [Bradyrhizobium manausense]
MFPKDPSNEPPTASGCKQRVQAQHLRQGDYLPATRNTVVSVSRGIRTPSGKVEVTLATSLGMRVSVWGARTEISIEREANRKD